MWALMLAPVVVVAVVSVLAALRQRPRIDGVDPAHLRTVADWRDASLVAVDVAGDPAEQLRQLVGALAERQFIYSSSIDRGERERKGGPVAVVDVRELRLEIRVRTHGGGRWILWVNEPRGAPEDSDDLRQLLTGLYQTLEDRKAEDVKWYRREGLASSADSGAPSPFYER